MAGKCDHVVISVTRVCREGEKMAGNYAEVVISATRVIISFIQPSFAVKVKMAGILIMWLFQTFVFTRKEKKWREIMIM